MKKHKRMIGVEYLSKKLGPLTFANALKSQRLSEELTLKQYSRFLGISIASLADLENGRRIPSPSRAVQIAKKLGEPPAFWVQLALQDKLTEEKINYKVTVA